ncbi:ATP-binding cassette domain-containing protein [Pseudofrankia sp. BMG5.37]|uniref:ATP-binding cassette domain-containing protein n=1 Tax=Pseudofrankia sp. BMG5.37 TaxID=3050035 RepID=UPI00289511E3|nr:ATP-binding cassette domain-containing protein [Pseudofrankia sp. BMG5.37]MDT3444338.1 ATP-binding cassette domain-containing protein [Pseudofrankia sp. BMG5.37]
MSYRVDVERLAVRHRGGGTAPPTLDDVSFSVEPGRVCGLFGREGAGKSTLLACLAAYRRPSGGTVRVDGEDPYENARLMSGICLVDGRGGIGVDESTTVREVLEIVALLRPRWDQAFANRLLDRFEVAVGAKVGTLARGRRAALAVTIGLASRAPLTMVDEAHLDLEPDYLSAFHQELRADQAAHPRTIILAGATVGEGDGDGDSDSDDGGGMDGRGGMDSHSTDSHGGDSPGGDGGREDSGGTGNGGGGLLDDVVLLGRGRVLAAGRPAELRALGRELTGEAGTVADFLRAVVGDATAVVADRHLGRLRSVVLTGPMPPEGLTTAERAGISVGPVGLRALVTYLTNDRPQSGDQRERMS